MLFSLTLFLEAQVYVSILICIWCFILNRSKLLNKLDLNTWFFITPLLIIRMVLPMEFSYTYTIPSRKILPPVANFFCTPIKENSPVWYVHILIVVCLIIAVIIHIYKLLKERRLYNAINLLITKDVDMRYLDIIDQLGYKSLYKKRKIAIVKGSFTTSPVIFHFKRPIILLPDIEFSDSELYYVLDHEFTHLKKRDIYYLKIVDWLNSLFWWNPFVYLFKEEFSKLLEMRVDHVLIKKYDGQQQIEYLDCILKVYKYQIDVQNGMNADMAEKNTVLLFSRKKESVLKKRLGYLMSKRSKVFSVMVTVMFCVVFFLSTCFVVEPEFVVQEVEQETFLIPDDVDTYFIYKGNDAYDMYVDGKFVGEVMNVEELGEFKDFPIYGQ